MAAADWRTDALISAIRRRANIPSSTEGWSDSDILLMATDIMRDSIVPMLRRLSEEFLVSVYDQNLTASTATYSLPSWALGEVLRDVQVADGGGGFVSLVRKEPHELSSYLAQTGTAPPSHYYLQDGKVVIVPTPSTTTTNGLRMKCLRRPSKLVGLGRAFALTSSTTTAAVLPNYALDGTTTEAVLGAALQANADGVDIVKATPGFRVLAAGNAPAYSTNALDWSPTLSEAPAAGDYACFAGESVVPNLPAETHPLLAQSVAAAYLRASGGPGYAEAEGERRRLEDEVSKLLSPRTDNQPRRIVNYYGAGWGGRRRY